MLLKLGSDDNPDYSTPSGGRFLPVTPEFFDSMVYKTGRHVALIGIAKNPKTQPLSETEYTSPVLSIV